MMRKTELTKDQQRMMEIARVGMTTHCPFYSSYYYNQLVEHPTKDWSPNVPGRVATDGKRVYFDPDYFATLKVPEQVFALAHETDHAVCRHPQRMKYYRTQGNLRGLPWNEELFNQCADLIINARLVEAGIGQCNPAWLYDPKISSDTLVEDLYEKLYKEGSQKKPPPGDDPGDGLRGQLPDTGYHPGTCPTYGNIRRGGKPDLQAANNHGAFDRVTEPEVDPVTGREDASSEADHKEAVVQAAAAAKAMGKYPGSVHKLVDEILTPQVSWREQLRLLLHGQIGSAREDWSRPNRRRLALSQGDPTRMIILPSRRGSGAGTIAVAIDSSGSIYSDDRALAIFFSELGGIVADCRPRRVIVIHCDAAVQRVDEVRSMAEVEGVRVKGTVGGGGTDFRPPFAWLKEQGIVPDSLVYLTDGYGTVDREPPGYPVVWAVTKGGQQQPWGEHVWLNN